ncbi:hypothetical protein WKK05_12855 [Nostoc sp. UHCC 0302]|uniref:hypothetical protein n=1 Tax=Nostoc sp. UHCC 0302 TaxID=3134896 RepID=UPI00311CDAB1
MHNQPKSGHLKNFSGLQIESAIAKAFKDLTLLHRCSVRQTNINFTFFDQGTIATICNGLKSQTHPHPALAALDAYVHNTFAKIRA